MKVLGTNFRLDEGQKKGSRGCGVVRKETCWLGSSRWPVHHWAGCHDGVARESCEVRIPIVIWQGPKDDRRHTWQSQQGAVGVSSSDLWNLPDAQVPSYLEYLAAVSPLGDPGSVLMAKIPMAVSMSIHDRGFHVWCTCVEAAVKGVEECQRSAEWSTRWISATFGAGVAQHSAHGSLTNH